MSDQVTTGDFVPAGRRARIRRRLARLVRFFDPCVLDPFCWDLSIRLAEERQIKQEISTGTATLERWLADQ